jgi:hypothetical protein
LQQLPAGKVQDCVGASGLVQANITAREAGVFMPVTLNDGQFRVVLKQPRQLYKRAWELADRDEEEMRWVNSGKRSLSETVVLARNMMSMTQ